MGNEIETWNMAQETMKRLSQILDLCVSNSLQERHGYYFKSLLELKKNISAFLSDTELEKLNNLFEQLPEGWWFAGEQRVNPQLKPQVEKTLDEIYIFCIRKMKKKGLLMPESKDPGTAVSRMS